METVERFDIVLDVTDREKLYDYVQCKEYDRPADGKWDMSVFKNKASLSCVHEDDENGQFRVELLDKAIADKRVLEKKSKSPEEKDEKTTKKDSNHRPDESRYVFDNDGNDGSQLPKRIIPFYKGGETIRGRVELVLSKSMPADRLVIGFQGRSYVRIRIYHAKGFYDVEAKEKYVREKIPLWQNADVKSEDLSDNFALLSTDQDVHGGKEIPAGSHSFNFEFTIPTDVPQSAPPVVISSINKGYLMYRIKAVINKGKTLARGNIVTHKGLWIKKIVDIAQDRMNLQPIHVEETLDTGVIQFWKSGKITVRAKLPRLGFVSGECVPVMVEIYNESKAEINNITACVRMYGKARLSDKRLAGSTSINIKSIKACAGPVPAGMCPVYNMEIPWDFSVSSADGNLLPVGDLDDSKLLDIKYEVVIKLRRKGLHRNMEISIPIVVGNINSVAAAWPK